MMTLRLQWQKTSDSQAPLCMGWTRDEQCPGAAETTTQEQAASLTTPISRERKTGMKTIKHLTILTLSMAFAIGTTMLGLPNTVHAETVIVDGSNPCAGINPYNSYIDGDHCYCEPGWTGPTCDDINWSDWLLPVLCGLTSLCDDPTGGGGGSNSDYPDECVLSATENPFPLDSTICNERAKDFNGRLEHLMQHCQDLGGEPSVTATSLENPYKVKVACVFDGQITECISFGDSADDVAWTCFGPYLIAPLLDVIAACEGGSCEINGSGEFITDDLDEYDYDLDDFTLGLPLDPLNPLEDGDTDTSGAQDYDRDQTLPDDSPAEPDGQR